MNHPEAVSARPIFIGNRQPSVRESIERSWLRAVRFFTYNTPIQKGKYRVASAAQAMCRVFPKEVLTPARDGRMLRVDFAPRAWDSVFFFGEYERPLSKVVESIIRPGDVCLDVGANFGWYTTLLSRLVGPTGKVHAFEPFPASFEKLDDNVNRLPGASNVTINNVAVGDSNKTGAITLDDAEHSGFVSVVDIEAVDPSATKCEMIPLTDYLGTHLDGREVTFLKADIEGAELPMLRGAEPIFAQSQLPILLIEMVADTSARFGYTPNDILHHLSARGDYRFVAFDEGLVRFRKIERFEPGHPGANVFCFPVHGFEDRLDSVKWLFNDANG